MGLAALKLGPLVLAGLLRPAVPPIEGETIARFDQALAATLAESDATARSRERVEILYRAGDLPGALREARNGLASAPADLALLRRALQLETALRLPELARKDADELAQVLRQSTFDEEARRWWAVEEKALSEGVQELEAHRSSLASAIARARWVSLAVLGAVLAACVAMTAARPRTD